MGISGLARFAALVVSSTLMCGAASARTELPPAPIVSRSAPATPTAQLKIFSSRALKGEWLGEGSNNISSDICVASSTGRYRLQVLSQSGGKLTAASGSSAKLRYTLRFRDGAGLEQVKTIDGQSLVTFEGSSPDRPDCSLGANASIEIDSSETDLLAQPEGNYADRLILSAEPL